MKNNPFNSWLASQREAAPYAAQMGIFDDSFMFSEHEGAAYAKHFSTHGRIPLPSATDFQGTLQVGSSRFSMPAGTIVGGGHTKSAIQSYYDELQMAAADPNEYIKGQIAKNPDIDFGNTIRVGKHSYSKIDGLKVASKMMLDVSKSTTTSSLGADFGLAFHRSKMLNISNVPYTVGGVTATLSRHLSKLDHLQSEFSRRGPEGIGHRQDAVQSFYNKIVGAVHGSTLPQGQQVFISGVKDSLFRSGGVVSTMGVHDIAFHGTSKLTGKGMHHYAKPVGVNTRLIEQAGLSLPATSGAQFLNENAFVSQMSQYHSGKARSQTTRYAGDTFFALGQTVKGKLVDSQILADSRSIAGREMWQVTHGTTGLGAPVGVNGGIKRKSVIIAGADDLSNIKVHSHLKGDIIDVMSGRLPDGMYKTDSGEYRYSKAKTIYSRQRKGHNPKRPYDVKQFLARQNPVMQGPLNVDDVRMQLVGAGQDRIDNFMVDNGTSAGTDVLGYRPISKGGGGFEILFKESGKRSAVDSFYDKPMVVGGRRVMQRQTASSLKTSAGKKVHQVVRAAEFGLGSEISEDFLSQYMGHIAHQAKSSGKLNELAGYINKYGGGGLAAKGSGASQHLHWTSETAGMGGNLFKNVQSILKMSAAQMEALGVSREAVKVLKSGPQGIHLNQHALESMSVNGENLMGVRLQGVETIMRGGTASNLNIGPGAMSMRMQDMMLLVKEQMSGIDPDSALGRSYGNLHGSIRSQILSGRMERKGAAAGLPGAGQELANLAKAMGKDGGNLIKGIKASSKSIDLADWVKSGAGALGNTEAATRAALSGGAMSQGMLDNTVHATGYKGELVKLPKAMKFALTPGGTQAEITHIPMLTDRFLGSTPHEQGKFLSSGGIRNMGLPRQKAMLATLMKEYGADMAAGKSTAGTAKLETAAQKYMTSLWMAMPGKQGLLYHNLKGQPNASMYGEVVNLGSIGRKGSNSTLDLALNPRTARKFLKHSNLSGEALDEVLSGKRSFYMNAGRYPLHQSANMGVMRLVVDKNMDPEKIGVSETFMRVAKGDFDKDTIAGFALDDVKQSDLERIHKHRLEVMSGYDKMMRSRENIELGKMARQIAAGEVATPADLQEAVNNSQVFKTIGQRMGSAAGGGAFVGPIHMGWARMHSLSLSMMDSESKDFISAIAKDAPELAKQLGRLKADKGYQQMMGMTRETGVYGILKKGATGFGKENVSALEALMKVGKGERSVDYAKDVFKSAFGHAQDIGQLELSNQNQQLRGALKLKPDELLNPKDKRIPGALTDMLFGGTGDGHQGIATIAKMQNYNSSHGIAEPIYDSAMGMINNKVDPKYMSQKIGNSANAILGSSIEELSVPPSVSAGNAGAEQITQFMNQQADEFGETVGDRAARAGGFFGSISQGVQETYSQLKSTMSTKWGKRVGIGAGLVLGIGAMDAMFGSNGDSDPMAPVFDSGGAPLPPQMPINFPDQGIDMPTAESFAQRSSAPARIERPYAQRQQYMIAGTMGNDTDFSMLGGGHMGTMGGPPVTDGMVVDGSTHASAAQSIRDQLRRSF